MKSLSRRQYAVFQIVLRFIAEHGYGPTFAQIGAELGVTPVSIHRHVHAIDAKGWWDYQGAATYKIAENHSQGRETHGND